MKYYFGIDVGGTTVKLGIFTQEGKLVDKWEIPTRTECQGENILPDIAGSVKDKMKETGIPESKIGGIGAGVPAPVKKDGFVEKSANLGWTDKEVKKELEKLTGIPAAIGNDANVAALGEMWMGAGRGFSDIIMVTLGTGVGGGIIVGGRPLCGSHGAGGEIGHITVNETETQLCGCGRKGCLEQYASATGIVRLAERYLENEKRDSILRQGKITAKDVFDGAKAGDNVAVKITEQFASCLGQALVNLAAILDPEAFVIGGGVSRAGDYLLDLIKKYFYEKAFYGNKDTKIMLATLGNDAGIYGAAKLCF